MNVQSMPRRLPAAVSPDYMASFTHGLATLAAGGIDAEKPKLKAVGDYVANGTRLYDVVDGVAVIGVQGILVDKFPYVGSSWVTGYDALRCQFAQAFADTEVRGIALDVDSGGGMVAGCFDLIDWIVEARQQVRKPIAAMLSESAYSAAYAIASGVADSIAVPRTGGLGSIGVVILHLDWSKMLEMAGVKPTFIQAGVHKTDGNPYEPLADAVFKQWQAETEDLRLVFAASVVRGRQAAGVGLSIDTVLKTEARCYSGPGELADALNLGLADAILPPEQAFLQFRKALAGVI